MATLSGTGATRATTSLREASSNCSCVFVKVLVVYSSVVTLLSAFQTHRELLSSSQIYGSLIATSAQENVIAAAAIAPKAVATAEGNTKSRVSGWDPLNPLAIPAGKAENLPSIRLQENSDVDKKRSFYGGAGDKPHLGGFTEIDISGISPAVWKLMIEKYGVHSVLDVGCGRGISTLWFLTHGVDILCAEGSHDAVLQSMLPDPATQVVEHDFSRGPWWPEKTYDAVWAVEFLEHVNVQFHFNYITAFRKSALLFVTSSRFGGWHHVEVHMDEWWIRKYEAYGFRYSPELTEQVRNAAHNEIGVAPNGAELNAQHVWLSMKVFINPVVAALPQHAHLFPEFGCFGGKDANKNRIYRECGTGSDSHAQLETPLAKSFYPLKLTPEMDAEWERIVKQNIKVDAAS